MVNSYSIANTILKRSGVDNFLLTPLKLHCFVYLLYSNYLYITGYRLIYESFNTLAGYPILPSLYYKFKNSNNRLIVDYVKNALDEIDFINGEQFNECLEYIWSKYKIYSDEDLLKLVTKQNSAYEIAVKNNSSILLNSDILDEEIERHEIILKKAKEFRNSL